MASTNTTTTTTTASPATSGSHDEFFQPAADDIAQLLIQIMVVVGLSVIVSRVFAIIKQPSVIAQIVTGILLGPTALGQIPDFTTKIFPTKSMPIFNAVADFGLIWFMFLIGLEVNRDVLKQHLKHSAFISITGVITPFMLGVGLSFYLISEGYKVAGASTFHFTLFVGVAMSITAFPVLARIISERSLLGTDLGLLILGSAAVDDLAAWIILALVVALVRAGSGINALYVFLTVIGFFIFVYLVVSPIIVRVCRRGINNQRVFIFLLLCVLACAWFTEAVGIHAIFGGFIFGLVVPRTNRINMAIAHKVEDYVVTLLLPLYFAKSGLRTNLDNLQTALDWGSCILIIVVACAGKIIPGICTSKICGRTWKEAFVVGFLSNAKGLVELIVLNIGLDLKIITQQVFGMLVLMAVVTTISATPLMYLVYPPKQILADDEANKARLMKLAAEANGQLTSLSSAPAPVKTATITVCYVHDNEAHAALSVAPFLNPTPGSALHFARIHEINEKPSSFIDSGNQAYDSNGSMENIPGAINSEMSLVLKIRARLLGQSVDYQILTRPWYTDPSEKILDEIQKTHSTIVLLPSEDGTKAEYLAQKLLRGSHIAVIGIVSSEHHLELDDAKPIQQILVLYWEDNKEKLLLSSIKHLVQQAHAVQGVSVTVFFPDSVDVDTMTEFELLTTNFGLKQLKQPAGTFNVALSQLRELQYSDSLDLLVYGVIDGSTTHDVVINQGVIDCIQPKLTLALHTLVDEVQKTKTVESKNPLIVEGIVSVV